MSLINDALKRAGEKPASVPSASDLAAGLSPAECRQSAFPVLSLLILLIPLIALGVWFLTKGLQLNEQPKPASVNTVAARAPQSTPKPVVIASPKNLPAVVPPPAVQPDYKLQGIYWRSSRPEAVINGKTVYAGDRLGKARISAIDQESVTLAVEGQSKVLKLP